MTPVVHPQVHAIDEGADGGVDGGNGAGDALPANGEVGDALGRAHAIERHVGYGEAEILQVRHLPLRQGFAPQHGHGHGHVLGALGSALLGRGGDDFLYEAAVSATPIGPPWQSQEKDRGAGSVGGGGRGGIHPPARQRST